MRKDSVSVGDLVSCLEDFGTGVACAISAVGLEWELHLPKTKTGTVVRELAREANLEGIPVLSGRGGFFLAETFEEIRAYEQELISRAMAILERARALASVVPYSSALKSAQDAASVSSAELAT